MRSRSFLNKPQYICRPQQIARRLAYSSRGWSEADTTVATLPWGAQLECWPAEAQGGSIMRMGLYDLLSTEALFRLADEGDLAVDVGANIGHMTSALACAVGPAGRVMGFEPQPSVYAVLERNVQRWREVQTMATVTPHAVAVSEGEGTAVLVSGGEFAGNRGTSRVDVGDKLQTPGSRHEVPTVRLDDVINESIGLLKLDCEGHETSVLAGARRLLAEGRIRDVVFEEFAAYPTPVTEALESAGLVVLRLRQRIAGPAPVAPAGTRRAGWDPPVFVASTDIDRARRRFRGWGWRALRERG